MSLMNVTSRLLRPVLLPVGVLSERLGNRFYIILALLMAAFALLGVDGVEALRTPGLGGPGRRLVIRL